MGKIQRYTSLGHTQLQLSLQSLFTLLVGSRNQAAGIDGLTAPLGPAQHPWDPHSPLICFPPEDQSPLDKTTTNKIQPPSTGKSPAPVLLPHSCFPWGWPLCIHVLLSPTLPALHAARDPHQLLGLNAAQCSPFLLHSPCRMPTAWCQIHLPRVGQDAHPVLLTPCPLPLAGHPSGTSLLTLPKHRSSTADARAFGNCAPRLWNALTAHHPAKCGLQHFSLLKHVRQRSRRLCPLDSTALCQPRRGKAASWRCLMPFQLSANARVGILLNPLSALS